MLFLFGGVMHDLHTISPILKNVYGGKKMPAKKRKNSDGTYTVSTPNQVHGRKMTLRNANAQVRLLNAIDHGWKPDKKRKKRHG